MRSPEPSRDAANSSRACSGTTIHRIKYVFGFVLARASPWWERSAGGGKKMLCIEKKINFLYISIYQAAFPSQLAG